MPTKDEPTSVAVIRGQHWDNDPFARIPRSMLRSFEVSPEAKVVWIVLASMAERYDQVYLSQTSIGNDCGLSRKIVLRCVAELVEAGWLKYDSRSGDTNRYTINRWINSDHLSQNGTTTCPNLGQPPVPKRDTTQKNLTQKEIPSSAAPQEKASSKRKTSSRYTPSQVIDAFRAASGIPDYKPTPADKGTFAHLECLDAVDLTQHMVKAVGFLREKSLCVTIRACVNAVGFLRDPIPSWQRELEAYRRELS